MGAGLSGGGGGEGGGINELARLPPRHHHHGWKCSRTADCPDGGLLLFLNVVHEVSSCSPCSVSEPPVLTLFLVLRLHW